MRAQAFVLAEQWIVGVQRQGGVEVVTRPVIRSFQNAVLPDRMGSARVDVEVLSGHAFVWHPWTVPTGEEKR